MAKEIKLSASRISTFLSCKLKYWFQYIEKIIKLDKEVFIFGNVVHNTLEFAGGLFIKNKNKFLKKDYKKIYDFYNTVSIELGLEDPELCKEGKGLVEKRLADFMDGRAVIGLETKFGFKKEDELILDNGVSLIGAIDKVEELNATTVLIVDYKTSKTAPTQEQLNVDVQLSIYDLVAKKLWPGYENVLLSLDLLKHDKIYTYRTDEQRESFMDYLKEIHTQMSKLTEETAKPKLNIFCAWCDFKDICPAYKKVIEAEEEVIPAYMNMNDKELVDLWTNLKSKSQILSRKEKDIAEILKARLKNNVRNELNSDDVVVYTRQNRMSYYDVNNVAKYIPKHDFKKVVKVNNAMLTAYLNKNAALKEVIDGTVQNSYTKPFLSTRKLKGK